MTSSSDLRSRLARLGYGSPSHPAPRDAETEAASGEPSPLLSPIGRGGGGYPIDQVVPGSHLSTPNGECFVVEQQHPAGHPHGACRLEEALEIDPQVLSWLGRDSRLAALDLGHCVFLDVETTGLAGGTGTYAFLVGVGHFQGPRFVVQQFFMEDYDAEEAMLHTLAEALERFQGVATFNGKAFDLPLLETRFQMARRPFPLRDIPHLDLLFPSRRLWRGRLESCALSTLEAEILGVERENDVPGWLIPGLYFDYLRSRDARPLAPVFEHNRHDLLSMAALVTRLARQHADPFHPELEDGRDLCALGVVFEGLGLDDRAVLCYERAMELDLSRDMHGKALIRLGNLYKRLQLRGDAVEVWRKLASTGHVYTTVAYVELAKHYEHAAREPGEAERFTLQALAALELRAARGEPWQVEQERRDLEHRLARLRRKIAQRRENA